MKRLLFLLLLLPLRLHGQSAFAFYQFPAPLPGATFYVCPLQAPTNPCSAPVNIYQDAALTQLISQPVTLGPDGNYGFYTNPGQYTIQIQAPFNLVYNISIGTGSSGSINNSGTTGALGYYATTGRSLSPDTCTTGSGNLTCNSLTTGGTGTGVVTFLNGAAPTAPASGKASTYVDSTTNNHTCLLSVGYCGYTGSQLRLPGATSEFFKWAVSATNGEVIGTSSASGFTFNFCGSAGHFSLNRDCLTGTIGSGSTPALDIHSPGGGVNAYNFDVYNGSGTFLGTPLQLGSNYFSSLSTGTKPSNPASGCQFWISSATGGVVSNNSSGNSCGAIQDAANFTGATFDVVLNACLTAATGGGCDASQITGAQTIAAQVNIPASTWLKLGAVTATCTISNGTSSCVSGANHSHLLGAGTTLSTIVLSSSANVASVYTNSDHLGAAGDIDVRNVHFQGNATAMVPQVVDLQAIFPPSHFQNNLIDCFPSIGVHLRNNNGWGIGPISLVDDYVNGTSGCATTSNRPIVIEDYGAANGGFMAINLVGGLYEHPGNNQAIVEINGQGRAAIEAVKVCVPYFENVAANTGQLAIKIIDASGVDVCAFGTGGSNSATGWSNVVSINETVSGLTNEISLEGITYNSAAAGGNTYNNLITNETSTLGYDSYFYGGKLGSRRINGGSNGLNLDTTGTGNLGFFTAHTGRWYISGATGAFANQVSGNGLFFPAAPTISSGFGTSPSIANNNGTAAFTINVGTGGTASSGVIGLPTAAHGWVVNCTDITTASGTVFLTKQTATSTTTATVANFNTSAALAAWAASDILSCSAAAY